MKKQLVTIDNLDSMLTLYDGKMYVDTNMILSPGAKDELAKRKVQVVYGPAPSNPMQKAMDKPIGPCRGGCGTGCFIPMEQNPFASINSLDCLAKSVSKLIRSQFGVTDEAELKKLTLETLNTLKNNI